MKKIIYLISIVVFSAFASCDSENTKDVIENEEEEVVTGEVSGTFTYRVFLEDNYGEDLLKDYVLKSGQRGIQCLKAGSLWETDTNCSITINEGDVYSLMVTVSLKNEVVEDESYKTKIVFMYMTNANLNVCAKIAGSGDELRCTELSVNDKVQWKEAVLGEDPSIRMALNLIADAEPIRLNLTEKVTSDNTFAFDLFKTTYANEEKENIFISPLSMSMALNMVLNGAEGDTKKEMLSALRVENYSMEQINAHSKEISHALQNVDPTTDMTLANAIWYSPKFDVRDEFVKVNRDYYDAVVKKLDFTLPSAVDTINDWCAEKTKGKITDVVQELSPNASMILANAIYFKGVWNLVFEKDKTTDETFYKEDGTTQTVKMMNQELSSYNYASDANAQYLEIPYGNKAFSMVLMLPAEGKSTHDVINHLNTETWCFNKMYSCEVKLHLPRFKAECKYRMEQKVLPQMGMLLPFLPVADFSGISPTASYISFVIHQTFVEVNEQGTEAAAVTVIGMDVSASGDDNPQTIIDYRVDKPFLFAICEKSTGAILFMGKIGEITTE